MIALLPHGCVCGRGDRTHNFDYRYSSTHMHVNQVTPTKRSQPATKHARFSTVSTKQTNGHKTYIKTLIGPCLLAPQPVQCHLPASDRSWSNHFHIILRCRRGNQRALLLKHHRQLVSSTTYRYIRHSMLPVQTYILDVHTHTQTRNSLCDHHGALTYFRQHARFACNYSWYVCMYVCVT